MRTLNKLAAIVVKLNLAFLPTRHPLSVAWRFAR